MEMILVLHAGVVGAILAGLVTPPLRWYSLALGGLMAVLAHQTLGLSAQTAAATVTGGVYVGSVLIILAYGMCVGYVTAYITKPKRSVQTTDDSASETLTHTQVARTRLVFKHAI